MTNTIHVLFVEDSQNDAKLLLMELRRSGWEIAYQRVDTAAAMEAALDAQPWNVIIADYSMPSFSGPAALTLARAKAVDVPFILVSGKMGEETAVQAMKAGADDYLFKGDLQRLVPAVTRELRDAEARRTARSVKQQLHQRDAQLVDALRLAHLGTWHADLRTGFTICSAETSRMLGRSTGNSLQTLSQFLDCLHQDDKKAFEECCSNPGTTSFQRDCQLTCVDQVATFVHIRGQILRDSNGAAVEAAGMIQDVTERHLTEMKIQQAMEAAERANRAKSEFLANMSHEIRTPMTAILGFMEMMAVPDISAEERAECIQTVRRNATHLLELINDILDLSKIEAGGMTVERVRCDVGKVLTDVVATMRARAMEKGLQFSVGFRSPIPAEILTDPLRLRQILVNLLGNAIKFTAAGDVKLVLDAQIKASKTIVKVDVIDSGIGLSPDQISRLFRPFAQAEESTTRKFGGTGLGLAISQQLAKLLGGEIAVVSRPGEGSTFSVTIKAGTVPEATMLTDLNHSASTAASMPSQWQQIPLQGRILLAEDGRDNQRLISTHLRTSGADVVIAENGQIAVDLQPTQSFDVILMDMQMPVMDGYTATATIRGSGFTKPIIALTAFAMAEDRDKCIAAGCTDYLTKPIDRTLLLTMVERYLNETNCIASVARMPVNQQANADPKIKSQLIDYPGMKNIIIEFVEGLPTEVGKIKACLQRDDMNTLRRIVHQLRGASGGYGFDQITQPAAQAEQSIVTCKNIDTIKQEIDALLNIIYKIDGFDPTQAKPRSHINLGMLDERVADLHH